MSKEERNRSSFFLQLLFCSERLVVIEFAFPFFRVTVVSKVPVPPMICPWFACGLDGAPIALGPGADFHGVGEQSIDIGAIETMNLLNEIQVVEKSAVIDDIVLSFHRGYPIEGEGGVLIDADAYIQNDCRDNHHVDEWD